MANIKQIAIAAGVSVTTVSRVLNGHPYVSRKKREAVLKAVKDLNYARNLNAVHLVKGKTNLIGVIIPYITNSHFNYLLAGIADLALKYGFQLILFQTDYNPDEERNVLHLLKMKQIDGIIICSKTISWEEITPYTEHGPIVACDDPGQFPVSAAYINHYESFKAGMDYLIGTGHRKIGYCINRNTSYNSKKREKAYRDALASIGEPVREEWIFRGCLYHQDGVRVVNHICGLKDRPTAILVAGDEVASGILTQARHAGIRVPEDLFIFGFDFQYIGELLQLPTVNNPISDIGRRAFEILYHHLKEETAEPVKAELKFSFIHRGQKDVRT